MFQAESVEIFCWPFHHCAPYLYSNWRCIFMVFWLVLFSDCLFVASAMSLEQIEKKTLKETVNCSIDANYSHHVREKEDFFILITLAINWTWFCFASLLYFPLLLRMKSSVCVLDDSENCGCICLSECRVSRTMMWQQQATEQNDPIVLRAVWPSMSDGRG